jgi:2-polyprenyl-6-methoxyphenol hydroxylase-like FAD-dependent oxidoreductase
MYSTAHNLTSTPNQTDSSSSPPIVDLGINSAVVVGAGLAGSLLAIYLAQRGLTVQLVERRGDMRVQETERGRSINLALSERGITALKGTGILDQIMEIAIPMKGRMIHSGGEFSRFFFCSHYAERFHSQIMNSYFIQNSHWY